MREERDREVRRAVDAGEAARGATLALRSYGAEVYGFLCSALDDRSNVRDAYGAFVEALAGELLSFRWRYDLRLWMYATARRLVLSRSDGDARNRPKTGAVSSRGGDAGQASWRCRHAPMARAAQQPFRQPSRERLVLDVRRHLSEEDRALLILRIDRRFTWRAIALSSLGESASARAIEREVLRVQKRFAELRKCLVCAARKGGIVCER